MATIQKVALLCIKNLTEINPNTLGWVRPDGIINFATNDAAKNYAINKCKHANKVKNKFERGIVVKDNMVLLEIQGKKHLVKIPFRKLSKYKDCDLYHNHPNPGTLSDADFSQLKLRKCLKTMTAVDVFDDYYKMTKLPVDKIKFLPQNISNIVTNIKHIFEGLYKYQKVTNKYKDEFNQIFKLAKEWKQQQSETAGQSPLKSIIIKKYHGVYLKFVADLDKMWCENAQSLGIKYEKGKI